MPISNTKSKPSPFRRLASKVIGATPDDKIKMPGKSNKFDYTNRANSGVKLGEIIGNTFQKEAEKVKKDAERLAAKARKLSSDGSDGIYEQSGTKHVIDLKAPGKELGDDAVCAAADGMESALKSGTASAALALEDLNLSGNRLTAVSLARLAPIISLARLDLKTINLSGNEIEIATDEQAEQWETFLQAFRDCMRLRRVDLSDNVRLGSRALEIFARVHVYEPPITPNPPGGNASVLSLVSEDGEHDEDDAVGLADSVTDGNFKTDPMTSGTFLKRMCGLRSVPYITLHNVGLDDAGALWYSYVLEDHYYPSQLISELNATNAESIIKAYQQNTHSRGMDWTENKPIGKEGAQLLEKTEMIREHRLHDPAMSINDILDVEDEGGSEAGAAHGIKAGSHPRAKSGNRRASMRSINSADGGEHEVSELESARKRIMRHIIVRPGVCSVKLWESSLQVLAISRLILCVAPISRKYHTGEPLFATAARPSPAVQAPKPLSPAQDENSSGLRVDTEKAQQVTQPFKVSYASKLQSMGEELAITDVTNTPTTPLRFQRPTHRKGAFSEGISVEEATTKLNALIVRDDSPFRFVRFQQRKIDEAAARGQSFRDRSTPTHLPADVFDYLLTFLVKKKHLKTCKGEQRRRAVARGQDRGTVRVEVEWRKYDESAQVLMLLDSVRCLHYGQ